MLLMEQSLGVYLFGLPAGECRQEPATRQGCSWSGAWGDCYSRQDPCRQDPGKLPAGSRQVAGRPRQVAGRKGRVGGRKGRVGGRKRRLAGAGRVENNVICVRVLRYFISTLDFCSSW